MIESLCVLLISWSVGVGGIVASVYYPNVRMILAIVGSFSMAFATGGILFMVLSEWREGDDQKIR